MPADIIALFQEHGLSPQKKTAKEWASPCPACGGTDRCSIWPEDQDSRGYYWCRQCDAKGDGIQFLRDYVGMSYGEACKRVGVAPVANLKAPSLRPQARTEKFQPVSRAQGHLEGVDIAVWRDKADAFVGWSAQQLMQNAEQLAWLAARGITAETAQRYRLGHNPGEKGKNCIIRPRSVWGLPPAKRDDGKDKRLWLPRGIVIPQVVTNGGAETVHRVRIRRLDADREIFQPKRKYQVVEGSAMDVLWLPCTTAMHEGGGVVIVVESELDAIMLHALAGDMAHCVAAMTSNIRNLSADVYDRLSEALCILVALDADKPGAEGWPRWQETFPRAKRWPVPSGKDPGEAFALGEDLRLWLLAGIPQGVRMAMPAGGALDMEVIEVAREERGEAAAVPSPVPSPVVVEFAAMWRNLPIVYTRIRDAAGNCVGFSWDCDYHSPAYSREKMDRFVKFRDQHDEIWEWLALNPANVITAKNFLKMRG